ncbi:MAG: DedA family protein [Chitinophagales bacterium]
MLDLLKQFVDIMLHLDQHLSAILQEYQLLTYVILFVIIFCETGLVVTPFLPGDSLLFAAGAIIAQAGVLNIWLLIILLIIAAILGDNVNFLFGRYLGKKAFEKEYWFLKREYLERTQAFYEKHGGKTIILARFVPIVRTFAPFVAGVGNMKQTEFMRYNIVGAIVWVTVITLAGYFFGQIPIVKNNFELVVLGIIFISILPIIIEFIQNFRKK